MALLKERRSGAAGRAFGDHCEELFRLANKDSGTEQACAGWWQHCFAHLPRSVEQLLQQREQLLQHQRAARSAAAAALRPSAYTRGEVLQAARAATTSAVTAVAAATAAWSDDAQKADFGRAKCSEKVEKQRLFFSSLVEGEGALHGLESLTATEVLGQLLRVLVASLVEQCRLACACVLVSSGSQESRCCTYSPGVAAAHFGHNSSGCKGQLFPCHIPALQTAADDLQRHAIAHAAGAAPAAAEDGLAWLPPLALLAACMRCEYIFSAAVGLCRLVGTDPPALAVVNRALQLLLLRLHQQEEAAATAEASSSTFRGDNGDQAGRKLPEAECDILVPVLSCSEKWALQQMLSRCHGSTTNTAAATGGTPAPPWEAVLPWPPFAQEFIFVLEPHTSDWKQKEPQRKWAFYCREQHADRTFAAAGERFL
ncbi:hypothetical protein, conserved [Eimeria brunetti]|uniref:Uncharacterized protein n=1 Tax=Eimeria brunetti TaxID=51314 RepID=U6LS03_9EIME|nr:hypothetical protein, conserved [Eimeria brunetti]